MAMQCAAKSKRSGKQCRQQAMMGRSVCYMHGGASPRGAASANFKTGKFSKDIPTRMAARYLEARQDPELLHQRDEISLLDARLLDVLTRVDTGESGRIWSELRKELSEFRAGPKDGRAAHLAQMAELIDRGHTDTVAWSEIAGLIEQRRRLVESERKRLVEMQQMITTEQALAFVGAVVAAVSKHVSDRSTLSAITAEFEILTTRPDERNADRAIADGRSGGGT
jgi:hypothetical protein